MATRTVQFNKSGIAKLPNDKPVIYTITTAGGKPNYVGVAKRGRVQGRIAEHLPSAKHPIPGQRVKIEQHSTIEVATRKEKSLIDASQPKYNKTHK